VATPINDTNKLNNKLNPSKYKEKLNSICIEFKKLELKIIEKFLS
jgi:hypothetical protein